MSDMSVNLLLFKGKNYH